MEKQGRSQRQIGSRAEIKKMRERKRHQGEKLHYGYYTVLISQSKEQAQAMLSFHNVKCVFEVMCWVGLRTHTHIHTHTRAHTQTHTHTRTHTQEHSWIVSQTTLKRKDVTEETE